MSDIVERKIAATKAFTKIGRANGSSPPESTENRFSVAYEFFIADLLRSLAKQRYEAALAAAIDAGVIKDEYTPGTHIPYNASGLSVVAKRTVDSVTLDKTALKNYLSRKYSEAEADEAITKASKPRKGATSHSISME